LALNRAGESDAAIAILGRRLWEQSEEVFESGYEIVNAFVQAGRTGELVELLESWSPPKEATKRSRMAGILYSAASNLTFAGDLESAERVIKKALAVVGKEDDYQRQNVRAVLRAVHAEQGRTEEARALLLDELLGPEDQRGKRQFALPSGAISHSGSGAVMTETDTMLEAARDAGMLDELVEAAQSAKRHDSQDRPNYARLAVLFAARRTEGVAELKELLRTKDAFRERANLDTVVAFLNQLVRWPEQRRLGMEWLEGIVKTDSAGGGDLSQQVALGIAWKRLAEVFGTDEEQRTSRAALFQRLHEAMITRPGYYMGIAPRGILDLAVESVEAGDLDAARALAGTVEKCSSARIRPGDFDRWRAVLEACEGSGKFVPTIWQENGRGALQWAIVPELPQGVRDSTRLPALRAGQAELTVLPGAELASPYDLEIEAGASEDTLTRVASIGTAAASGRWDGRLPDDARFAAVALRGGDGEMVRSAPLPVARGRNLLPPLDTVGDDAWKQSGVRWSGLARGPDGVPRLHAFEPARGFSRVPTTGEPLLRSPAVKLAPGNEYVCSIWLKPASQYERARAMVRFIDKERREVGGVALTAGSAGVGRRLFVAGFSPDGTGGDYAIPAEAVAAEMVIEAFGHVEMSEPYFGER
jgi:hypothetical protein